MKKRLIIHGGMHKCGSTSLQSFLFSNREILVSNGILYPETGMRYGQDVGNRHFFVRETLFKAHDKIAGIWRKIYDEAESASADTVILSYEIFLSPGMISPVSAKNLQNLFNVYLINYQPNPITYFNSKYKEWVRRLNFSGEPSEFVLNHLRYLHIDRLLDNWVKAIPSTEIICVPFDRSTLINL